MCRRRRDRARSRVAAVIPVLAIACAAAATPVMAEAEAVRPLQTAPPGADQNAPADSSAEAALLERLAELRQTLETRPRRRARDPVPLDTAVVAGVRVIAPTSDMGRATLWVDRAAGAIRDRMGPLSGLPVVTFGLPWTADPASINPDYGYFPSELDRIIQSAISENLTRRLPEPVAAWLTGPVGAPASPRRELTWSANGLVRECVEGRTGACVVALGLAPVESGELGPEAQRQFDAAVASDRVQRLDGGRVAFVSPEVRRSFLHAALRSHPGALERLLAETTDAPSTVAELLTRATGAEIDALVAAWRDEVLSEPHRSLPVSEAGSSLLWVLVFLAFAARSTRWRLP